MAVRWMGWTVCAVLLACGGAEPMPPRAGTTSGAEDGRTGFTPDEALLRCRLDTEQGPRSDYATIASYQHQ